ncbi:Transcription initiation factor TFIID subunit 5 [Sphaceloma murrayae]|uniref:Transcription initiation factor TFIID subunit 5 n=1 Tax=Sphaceloma murrayae TaxID=2082308 RepID=A0A2K1R2Q8_9PEZI|nr:Transcription initiation factor TFIID subunit 5 [Sphaceloma murrayae]
MPADDSPAVLVARFLRANNYSETLEAFLAEAGLPPDAGTVSRNSFTLEKLLDEKRTFDLSVRFEKLGENDNDTETGWRRDAPSKRTIVSTLPSTSNILHTSFESLCPSDSQTPTAVILATTADRRLNVIALPSLALDKTSTGLQDSPVLSYAVLDANHVLAASMSGQLTLAENLSHVLDRRRDHTKYIVKVVTYRLDDDACTILVATAGWDAKIHIYRLTMEQTSNPAIPEPFSTITLPSNPEALQFLPHPESGDPILIVTRRDSSFLYYYTLDTPPRLLGRQNLAPHSNAWVAFTPSAIALSPTDPSLLAIATSAVPHMKLIITRLLIPPIVTPTDVPSVSQAAQARAEMLVQDREAAAIQIHCSTLAPQTPYSTPALVWRPDGSGLWVNSDDGVIRGFERTTGKHVVTLAGHEPGTKVRCLASSFVEVEGRREEWLVSGGFDQKLIVWKPETEEAAAAS